ncbi:MAG: hypothetical protein J6Q84_05480, partial [Kiritimatiellae bacterium]|nr:hypothetical protein [Kiritimatiellia bacterium]
MKKSTVLLAIVPLVNFALWGATVNILPNGNDENGDGSLARPFATLARAVEVVKKNPTEQNEIVIGDGTYRFTGPVTIDAKTPVTCVRAAN